MKNAIKIAEEVLGFSVDFEDLPKVSHDTYSETYTLTDGQIEALKKLLPSEFEQALEDFNQSIDYYDDCEEDTCVYVTIGRHWFYKSVNRFTHTVGVNFIEIYIMNQCMSDPIYIIDVREEVNSSDND